VVGFLTAAEHAADEAPAGRRGQAAAAAAAAAGAHGPGLGLDEGWAARILDAVGTYADLYHRNLGDRCALGVPRGLNDLWTRGGLHYAFPLH
jgi:general L-amino acid transport system substrate-binding protein